MIASPCIGVCRIDDTTGFCVGCARSRDELARWAEGGDIWRQSVWAALPDRLQALGVNVRRPGWTSEDIRAFASDTLSAGIGTCWVLGCYGGVAEFVPYGADRVAPSRDGETLTAHGPGGALRVTIDDRARALQIHTPDSAGVRATVLAVHRKRLALPVATGLAEVGADGDAIDPVARGGILFDMGLGRAASRFMLRTAEPELIALLKGLVGEPVERVLTLAGSAIVEASPTRVVQTALGRAEITAPIPPPGGRSPAGSHTHLLPDALAVERDLPPGLDVPGIYAPAAVVFTSAGSMVSPLLR